MGLQFTFALLILKTSWGAAVFSFAGAVIRKLLEFANEGCQFVFGPLAADAALQRVFPEQPLVFAVLVTGTIILVSALASLFYHWGCSKKWSMRWLG